MLVRTVKYPVLGTLGSTDGFLTCSMHIAKEWDNADEIKPYPYFEDAAADLRAGIINCLLVLGAYPKISDFIMDLELEVAETFIRKIPPLVLCGTKDILPESIETVFHHPATTHLLSEIDTSFMDNKVVSSNPEACRMVLEKPDNSICITNGLCPEYYGLKTYKVLRDGIKMPWICFIKNSLGVRTAK